MRIVEKFRKRRAIKAFVRVLSPLLKKRYGKHKRYTEGQVKKTVEAARLDQRYIDYACAMYMNRRTFEEMTNLKGITLDYDEVRQEVADDHFNGNAGFTIHDTLDAARTSHGFFGGDSAFDDYSGDFGDGSGETD
jgi:hypothetical protein